MLTFGAPLWLLALALVPVIRWLHRGGRTPREVAVAHLGVWADAPAPTAPARRRQPPDPAWRRRALLASLLVLALAQPQWPQTRVLVTVWIDDTASMLTREDEGTRLAIGLAQARALAAATPGAEVEVRTLGDPWRALPAELPALADAIAARAGVALPAPPPAALLRPQRQHWLVTGGADPTLLAWPEGRRPDRTIRVGRVSSNVGIERIAARSRTADRADDRIDLLLKLTNGGADVQARDVVVTADGAEVARVARRLEPGVTAIVEVTAPAATVVQAALHPTDALAFDDTIALDLRALQRRRVAVDPACPPAVQAAVAVHPGLVPTPPDDAGAEAALDCGAAGAIGGRPALALHAAGLPTRLHGPLRWSSALVERARALGLAGQEWRSAGTLTPGPGDNVLLAAGDDILAVERAGTPRRIEAAFDAAQADRDPALPLLLHLLLERLLDTRLLDATAIVDRGASASRVVPIVATDVLDAPPAAHPASVPREGTLALLWAAACVLGWEIGSLLLRAARLAGTRASRTA